METNSLTIEFQDNKTEGKTPTRTEQTLIFTKGRQITLPQAWIHQQELRTGNKVVLTATKQKNAEGSGQKTLTITPKEETMTVYKTVQVPLMDDRLTPKKKHQLDHLTTRDTSVIKRYLEIIDQKEDTHWREGREGQRLDTAKVDALTLTSRQLTRKGKTTTGRETVLYPLQQEFDQQITIRELKECRDIAIGMWHVYREQVAKHQTTYWKIVQNTKYVDREDALIPVLDWWEREKHPQKPCQAEGYATKGNKIPRRINHGTTMFFHERLTKLTPY